MHFEQRRPENNESSILPLINVVFLLLVFCMLAGSLTVTEPFAVELPDSVSEGVIQNNSLRLLLGKDQQLAIDGQRMQEKDLLVQVKQRIAENPNLRIELKADADVVGNRVVLLMEALHTAGAERLYLMTLRAEP